MNNTSLTLLLLFSFFSALAQNSNARGDSLLYQGRWYAPTAYEQAKKAYEKSNFETWFMPGLGYTYYFPKGNKNIGAFSGLTVEYLIYADVDQNDNPGPSHVRFYSKLNILKSDKTDVDGIFMYTLGLDLSLEKNPNRNWLIPYFGLEMGGLSQKTYGSCLQFTPTFGVHALSRKNLFINLHGGYVYPLRNFEVLQGWYGQLGVNFALW